MHSLFAYFMFYADFYTGDVQVNAARLVENPQSYLSGCVGMLAACSLALGRRRFELHIPCHDPGYLGTGRFSANACEDGQRAWASEVVLLFDFRSASRNPFRYLVPATSRRGLKEVGDF
jgi:hypothetical protein